MIKPAIPAYEGARLEALRAMRVLDTPPEAYLDRIVEVAAQLFNVPTALITMVDAKRQWFKARRGLGIGETLRDTSFCGHAILGDEVLFVPDASVDPRFADNPLVTGDPAIRFYAGKPIHAPTGERIGTLCVIDSKPRAFSGVERRLLELLAACAEDMLAMRAHALEQRHRHWWFGVAVTVVAAGLFELFATQVVWVPNPPAVLIATVVYSAFHGGLRAGLISAVVAWLYFAHFFSIPGQPFSYTPDNLLRVIVWAIATPSIAFMTGLLQRRSERLSQLDRVNTTLTSLLAERAAALTEMDELNKQIRLVVDSAPMQIAFYDKNRNCVYGNRLYAAWFGHPGRDITGMHVSEVVGETNYSIGKAFIDRALDGETTRTETQRVNAAGQQRTLDVTLAPHIDAAGQVDGFYSFFFDVTERRKAEESVRQSEKLNTATLGAALDAIISVDHEGRILEFNPAAERCFGHSREAIRGKALVDTLIPPDQRAKHQAGFDRFIATGKGTMFDRRLVLPALRADGKLIEVEITILRLPGTEPPVLTAFARDVTEVRRAEALARRSQERLESALAAAKFALFEIEAPSGKVFLNETWAEMVGDPPGATHTELGELAERVHPGDREAVWHHALDTLQGRTDAYEIEHRVQHRDGHWIWILSRCRVVERDADGKIRRLAGANVDITERKHAEQRMHYLATRDALTDLANRSLFGDRLREAIEKAENDSDRVALISIGLDRFTMINDSFGQSAGDLVLRALAERLTQTAPREAVVARPGGDEFLVLIPRFGTVHEVTACAESICATLSKPIAIEGRELVVTASVGVALFPEDGDSAGLLLRNADIALHNAKEAGRDKVQFFASGMNVLARARLDTEAALRLALDRDEFVLYYQPQFELATGALIGVEALVRWRHPQRGLVPPGEFVPIAESSGLIVAIGEHLLAKACRQAAQWQRIAERPLRVAVNVTARQFHHRGFLKSVNHAVSASGLDPHLLELEITENAIMEQGAAVAANLDAIRDLGVELAIDDFGTGYSSLSYLKRLPVDSLKIDQSFVADLPNDPEDCAIVNTIIALAHNLGLKVLAEGVETREQFLYLKEHGCDAAQGYYFGRPTPPEELRLSASSNVISLGRTGTA